MVWSRKALKSSVLLLALALTLPALAADVYEVVPADDSGVMSVETGKTIALKVVKTGTREAVPVTAWIVTKVKGLAASSGDNAPLISDDLSINSSNIYSYGADKTSAANFRLEAGSEISENIGFQVSAKTPDGQKTKAIDVFVIPSGSKLEFNAPAEAQLETGRAHLVAKATTADGKALTKGRVRFTVTPGLTKSASGTTNESETFIASVGADGTAQVNPEGFKVGEYKFAALIEGLTDTVSPDPVDVKRNVYSASVASSPIYVRVGQRAVPIDVKGIDAEGNQSPVELSWDYANKDDEAYVELLNEDGATLVRAKKARITPIVLVGKLGDKEMARVQVVPKAELKGLVLLGPTSILTDSDISYEVRLKDSKGATSALPAGASIEVTGADNASAYVDPKNPNTIIVRAEKGGKVTVNLNVSVPDQEEPISDAIDLRARGIVGFSPVRVNLNVVDDATAKDLFGQAIASNFYVVRARIFNNLDRTPDGSRTGQAILAYRDSIEVGIELEKKYDDGRKSDVPVAFRSWTQVQPADFVREYARPYENEANAVSRRTASSDTLLIRGLANEIQIGGKPGSIRTMRVKDVFVPQIESEGVILPPTAYTLTLDGTSVIQEPNERNGTLRAVHTGITAVTVNVDGKPIQTFLVRVIEENDPVVATGEATVAELVEVGRSVDLAMYKGTEPLSGVTWVILDKDGRPQTRTPRALVDGSVLRALKPGNVVVEGTAGLEKHQIVIDIVPQSGAKAPVQNGSVIQGLTPSKSLALIPTVTCDGVDAIVTRINAWKTKHIAKPQQQEKKDKQQDDKKGQDSSSSGTGASPASNTTPTPGMPKPGDKDPVLIPGFEMLAWHSRDTKVATVNAGALRAVGPGTTVIEYGLPNNDGGMEEVLGRIYVTVDDRSDPNDLPPSVFRNGGRYYQIRQLFRYRPYSDQMVIGSFEARENETGPTLLDRVSQIVQSVGSGLILGGETTNLARGLAGIGLVRSAVVSAFPSQRDVRRQNLVSQLMPPLVEIPFGGEVSTILLFPKQPISGMIRGHKVRISEIDTSYFNITVGIIDKRQNTQTAAAPVVAPVTNGAGAGGTGNGAGPGNEPR